MKHYVYKLIDQKTGKYYFGSRSHEDPENDDYMGSYYTWKPEDETRLLKEIISDEFDTREEAIELEAKLIEDNINDDLNENYFIPNKGFHTMGTVTVRDENGNTFQVNMNDERYISGKIKHINVGKGHPMYGKRIPKETRDKISKTKRKRYKSGEIVNGFLGKCHSDEYKKMMSKIMSKHQSGTGNSNYGKMWIYNEKLKKSKLIDNESTIPDGWNKGRKIKF